MAAAAPPGDESAALPIRSLAEALGRMDDHDLEQLFRERPDLARPIPDDLSGLAQSAGSAPSVRLACRKLNRLELQVLEVLVAHTQPVSVDELVADMDPDSGTAASESVAAAIARCRALALVWGEPTGLRAVAALHQQFGPAPCGLDTVDRSQQPLIAEYLHQPDRLLDAVAKAPAGARSVLERLLWGPPRGTVPNAHRPVSQATAATPVEWLLVRELLVPVGPDAVVLPREVALLLRGGRYVQQVLLPPGSPVDPAATPVADADAAAGMRALESTRAAGRLLAELERGTLRVLRNGGMYQRDALELARRLHLTLGETAVLADLLLRAGLLAADEQTGVWALTRHADSWRIMPTEAAQWAALIMAWRENPAHPTAAAEGALRVLSDDLLRTGVVEARRSVLSVAAATGPGFPLDAGRVAESVAWHIPPLSSAGLPGLVAELLAEAEFLGITGRGALSAAGRRLAATEMVPDAIAEAAVWPPLVERLVLQADLTATALGPMAPGLEARIGQLADLESTGAGTVYRFSDRSLQRAFDAGMATAEVTAELADLSLTGLPVTLEALVTDVGRRHGAVHVARAGSVITSDDDAVLAAATADRTLAHLRLHRIAAGVAISPLGPDEVTTALRKSGVLAVTAAAAAPRPRRIAPAQPVVFGRFPSQQEVAAAVRAVRAGQAAQSALTGPGQVAPMAPHDLVQTLQDAIGNSRSVWLDFSDASGTRRLRQVQPIHLRGGMLSGYEQRERRVLAFPLSRIFGISVVADPDGPTR